MAEGQGGDKFFTSRSALRLMVGIIEQHGGTVFDPACGSGGFFFVRSADFIEQHRRERETQGKDTGVCIYGQKNKAQRSSWPA